MRRTLLAALALISAAGLIGLDGLRPGRLSRGDDPHTRTQARPAVTADAARRDAPRTSVSSVGQEERERLRVASGRLPLSFEQNDGQFDPSVSFAARGDGYAVSLGAAELVLDLRDQSPRADESPSGALSQTPTVRRDTNRVVVRMAGANPAPRVAGGERLPGVSSYFIGRDPAAWRANVPTFASVEYRGVYPGIDLVYYGNQRQLEYDFRLAPGADPRRIAIEFEGADDVRLDANGDLVLGVGGAELRQLKPVSYQLIEGRRREVESRYVLASGGRRAAFELGDYDPTRPLVIDPVLSYSTYLGGAGLDEALAVARGSDGSLYVAGRTNSTDFPATAGALQTARGGPANDAFVIKLNAALTSVVYATYVGGAQTDEALGVAVDGGGNAYLAGHTSSADFPTTAGALQPAKGGVLDAFALKLNPSGTALAYSTCLGGQSVDWANGVAVDSAGRAHVVGYTHSSRFLGGAHAEKAGSPVYKTTDSAASWQPAENGLDDSSGTAFATHPTDPNTAYAGTTVGVYKTTDGGASWALTGGATTDPANNPSFVTAILLDPASPSMLYVATGGNGVFRSTDGGASYARISSGLPINLVLALAADPNAPGTIYAGTLFGVAKTTNGGASWSAVNNGLGGNNSSAPRVLSIAVDPTNPAVVYAATSNGVFKTTTGGAAWAQSSNGLGDQFFRQVNTVLVVPGAPSVLYAGLDFGGAFKSTDGGASWAPINAGLQVQNEFGTFTHSIIGLAINPAAPSVLYAAARGAGIFKSTDGGATWAASGAGIANRNPNPNALEVARANPSVVYAGFSSGADAFAVRLSAAGAAADYSVLLGGDENEAALGVALDPAGNAYLTGATASLNFPVVSPLQATSGGGFSDVFVAKLGPTGATLYSTYLGGNSTDEARAVAVDASGRAYVAGRTFSPNFPTAGPRQTALNSFGPDLFVARLGAAGSSLEYSVLHGGQFEDEAAALALDAGGNAYVTGHTRSPDFPVADAPQPALGGTEDALVLKLGPASEVIYSTYLGGSGPERGFDIAADAGGAAYVVGRTASANFPLVSPLDATFGGGGDAFLVRLGTAADLSLTLAASRDVVMVGNQLVYTLKVTNAGPSPANNVQLDGALTGASIFTFSMTQGGCVGSSGDTETLLCPLGVIEPGASVTVTLTISAFAAPRTITLNAAVKSDELDTNPANNAASHTAQASSLPSIAGRVLNADGSGLAGVSVSLSGSQSATATTDARGYYQFTGLAAGGNYVVTPARAGFTFAPLSRTFNDLRQDAAADFAAAPCSYGIAPSGLSASAAGGASSVAVTANGDCPWTAVSHSDWITITSGASGRGDGTVNFTVAPTTAPRAGRLTIAGRTFVVYQEFASCAVPAFQEAKTYALSISPTELVAADFNKDGRPDLAALQTFSGQNSVAVLLANGTGGFGAPAYYAAGFGNRSLAAGDLNNDGYTDLIAMDLLQMQVLINNGSGGFNAPVNRALSPRFHHTAHIADFNLDGKLDVAVTHDDANNDAAVSVLLGDGAGGFGQPTQVLAASVLAVADFNNDGKPDLATTPLNPLLFGVQTVAVRLGDGAGAFGPAINSTLPGQFSQAAAADVNGDGRADLVTRVGLLLGRGDGGFNPAPAPAIDANGGEFILADLNNDARPDIAQPTQTGLSVFPGDGAGNFGPAAPVAHPPSGTSLVAADLNGDGRNDLALVSMATFVSSNSVSVFMNGCNAAAAGIQITGRVMNEHGVGISNAIVRMTSQRLGTLTAHTDLSGSYAFRNLPREDDYTLTAEWPSFVFNPQTVSRPSADTVVNFTAVPNFPRFDTLSYTVSEGQGSVRILVRRPPESLNRSEVITVATVDDPAAVPCDPTARRPDGTPYPQGAAYARCDYATTVERLHFPAGQELSGLTVPVIDDGHAEGPETVQLRIYDPDLPNAASPPNATLTITDNDAPGAPNPLDGNRFFVRMQYLDFLNREPEQGEPWTKVLDDCPNVFNTDPNSASAGCDRLLVSSAFFRSPEFALKGFYSYLFYRVAFDRRPEYAEITPDMRSLAGATPEDVFARRAAYAVSFTRRAEFAQRYGGMTNQQYVAALLSRYDLQQITTEDPQDFEGTAQVTLTREQLVAALDNSTLTRAQVLRAVVQSSEVDAAEFHGAFVSMQYYGYLRRTPEQSGYDNWVRVIRQDPNNIREMVRGFVNSQEYRLRFGQQ